MSDLAPPDAARDVGEDTRAEEALLLRPPIEHHGRGKAAGRAHPKVFALPYARSGRRVDEPAAFGGKLVRIG
jgi:hypothetical protein